MSDALPPENVYKALMRARVLGALESARVAASITHRGVKGRVREIILSDLFRPLLPADIGIASGQIVDRVGGLSRQKDIILFDRTILPPISFDPSAALIPIEAALYAIEVKSVLDRPALVGAHKGAMELGQQCEAACGRMHVRSVLFALRTSISATKHPDAEPARYKSIYASDGPAIAAFCIAGRGYWFEKNGSWVRIPSRREGDDVLSFIGGVMNSYRDAARLIGSQNLGDYIIERPDRIHAFPSGTRPTILVRCESCAREAVAHFPTPVNETMEWQTGYECPSRCECSGKLSAPAGIYILKGGRFERQP